MGMKYTLLEMVQDILSAMDSDEVTSITDNEESQQVVKVIKWAFYDIVSDLDFLQHEGTFSLVQTDANTPVIMSLPTTVSRLDWLKYNWKESGDTFDNYKDVEFLPFKDFIDMTYQLGRSSSTTETCDTLTSPGVSLLYRNDKFPEYYTTNDDNYFIFDSYNSAEETYLTTANNYGQGWLMPTFTESDSFVIDLPATQFSLLRNQAKELAFSELKQVSHNIASMQGRRAKVRSQAVRNISENPYKHYPNNVGVDFGRK